MTSDGSPSLGSLPIAAGDCSGQRRDVRRRLVQSTLFPQRTEDEEEKEEVRCWGDDGCGGEVVVVVEEECGSRKKRSRGKAKAKGKETSTPRRSSSGRKAKQHSNSSTPRKNGTSNSRKCGLVPKMLDLNEVDDGSPPQPIPNLRMEAKTTAEENSRLFAGKQIHPFFLSRRLEKKFQDVARHEGEESCACDDGDGQSVSIGPIHVFEKNQEDYRQIFDWGSLTFSAGTSYREQVSLVDGAFSSALRGNVRSLTFDTFKSTSNAFDALTLPNNVLSPINIPAVPHVDSDISNDAKLDPCEKFLKHAGCTVKSDNEPDSRFLDSVRPYYAAHRSCLPNTMWTDKYKPRRSSEVCGNHESVRFLSTWLHHWHGSNHERIEGVNGCENYYSQPSKCSQDQSDSDSDCRGMEAQLKNVMLITGSVGCGKSAAVYACAKEQGFEVMEVNVSECRNGAVVKQKFGEAFKSRWLKRLSRNQGDYQRKQAHLMVENCKSESDGNLEQVELIRVSDGENSNEYGEQVSPSDAQQVEVKRLILFEDVDIIFLEDRGLISSIQHIAETAKGPLIMTSNNSDLVLPENLKRHHIFFSMPSAKELLYHLHMICLAEKACIHHYLLEKFLGSCRGDIRRAILLLQFWCQGTGCGRDGILQRSYGPALLDLESCHGIIPKLMPWDCHSELSELVEKNITESLCPMEQACTSMKVIEESVQEEAEHPVDFAQIDINWETKKEAMLRRNCSSYEDKFAVQSGTECHVINSLGTLTFSHNKRRKKLGILTSSDSEDGNFQDKDISLLPEAGTKIKRVVFSPGKVIQNFISLPCEKLYPCEELNKEKRLFPCSNRQANINFDEPLASVDVSRFQELTYVPETDIGDGRELSTGGYCCNDAVMRDASPGDWSIQDLSPVKCGAKYLSRLQRLSDMEENNCGATVSPHRETEDVHVEYHDDFLKGWKIIDECSRFEFNSRCKHDASCHAEPNLVAQSWARLRADQQLKNYIHTERIDASQSVELANKMAHLISEVDILLCRCQEVVEDYLEPAMICDKPESFSWCDDQWLIASTIIQHGVCSYARDAGAIASNKGLQSRIDLASEMLALARKKNAAAKLTITSTRGCIGPEQEMLDKSEPPDPVIHGSVTKASLLDVVQSIIPGNRHLCTRRDAFYEYVSSLGYISKAECSRLSQGTDKNKRRRRWPARHYLSSGVLMLSPEDISLLCTNSTYRKNTS